MAPAQKNTERGSAMIEGAAAAIILSMLISGLFLVLYLSFAKVWTKSALYDGLICIKEQETAAECRARVQKRLAYLPWGQSRELILSAGGDAHTVIQINSNLKFKVNQTLPEGLR